MFAVQTTTSGGIPGGFLADSMPDSMAVFPAVFHGGSPAVFPADSMADFPAFFRFFPRGLDTRP